MIVMKFGGSSIGDAGRIRRVIELIRAARSRDPLVVVSAHSGVTDSLEEAAFRAAAGRPEADALRQRHAALEADLGLEIPEHRVLFAELDQWLHRIARARRVSPELLDAVRSFGERLAAPTLARALEAEGLPATAIVASDAGLRTDSRFGAARVLPDSDAALRAALRDRARLPVITGFVAQDGAGRWTTVGRNGSDYTAAVFARALAAEELQIWTDVPGVLTADPRVVPGARTFPSLYAGEAEKLARAGAKVLHPLTMQPCLPGRIPVQVLDASDPGHPGTRILPAAGRSVPAARAVVFRDRLRVCRVTAPAGGDAAELFLELAASAREEALPLDLWWGSAASLSLAVPDGPAAERWCERWQREVGLETLPGQALVALVGGGEPQNLRALLEESAPEEESLLFFSRSASAVAMVCERGQALQAARTLHEWICPTPTVARAAAGSV